MKKAYIAVIMAALLLCTAMSVSAITATAVSSPAQSTIQACGSDKDLKTSPGTANGVLELVASNRRKMVSLPEMARRRR